MRGYSNRVENLSLEEDGLIESRGALLNEKKLGLNVTVFAHVKLSVHGKKSLSQFETEIGSFAEVLECYTMMGEYDFLFKIIARDIEAYEIFFRKQLSQMFTVQKIHSNVALSKIKYTTAFPI